VAAKKGKPAPPRGRLNVFLRQGALHKGLLGDSRAWRVLFFVMFGGRMFRKLFGKTQETVLTEKLKPGQVLQLRTLPQKTRADRKRYRRTA
jgi:hypothetical protein